MSNDNFIQIENEESGGDNSFTEKRELPIIISNVDPKVNSTAHPVLSTDAHNVISSERINGISQGEQNIGVSSMTPQS